MPSPFPGMNPYLEDPVFWAGIHQRLIIAIANSLAPQLRPKYVVAVEVRTYETSGEESTLIGIPDDVVVKSFQTNIPLTESNVAVTSPPAQPITVTVPIPETLKQGYLEVKKWGREKLLRLLKFFSPIHKKAGEGRRKYESKRLKILGSFTHLVEIDLLRQGEPMPILTNPIQSHYRILVSPSDTRPKADLYAFNLQDVIPSVALPLQKGDSDLIELQKLLHEIYIQGCYDLMVDYTGQAIPALSATDAAWSDALLRQQGLR